MAQDLNPRIIAAYLQNNPNFFNEYPELLANIRLTSPVLGKTISFHERQIEVIREKNKNLELHIAELIRIARDNDTLTFRIQKWIHAILKAKKDVDRVPILVSELKSIFSIPYATIRLWNTDNAYHHEWFTKDTSENIQLFARNLREPYCGRNHDHAVSSWLGDKTAIASIALIPLKTETETFGLLVLGSPDEARFRSDMATDFLSTIAKTASAALTGLLDN